LIRDLLHQEAKRVEKSLSKFQSAELGSKRSKLLAKYEDFQNQCSTLFPDIEQDDICAVQSGTVATLESYNCEEEDGNDADTEIEKGELSSTTPVERLLLWMPSTITPSSSNNGTIQLA
jgi:hypothetical protein